MQKLDGHFILAGATFLSLDRQLNHQILSYALREAKLHQKTKALLRHKSTMHIIDGRGPSISIYHELREVTRVGVLREPRLERRLRYQTGWLFEGIGNSKK
jgi:hypothetical protein